MTWTWWMWLELPFILFGVYTLGKAVLDALRGR
jgi:hypothetical protein